MLRFLKYFLSVGLLSLSLQPSMAFVLYGPIGNGGDAWQTIELAYGLPGDEGAPKNLGEEFRRNTPVIYYAFDASFLDYFGSNGVVAVEQAISVYNGLTNVSSYRSDLSEFPLSAQRENYQAEGLLLTDLKSVTMHAIAELMGLGEPERYLWSLHDRLHVGTPPCPVGMEYTVVQRNFDPMTLAPSSYINGTLYSYYLLENCVNPPAWLAVAEPFSVDPLAEAFTAIASFGDLFGFNFTGGLVVGRFNIGLTRDDVGGLRYMLSTNNVNFENAASNSVMFVTNGIATNALPTFDLGLLASLAATNTAAQLQAIFPGLIDTSAVIGFAVFTNANVSLLITNAPFAPPGLFTTVFVTNPPTISFLPVYSHTFDNVITNQFSTRGFVLVQTVSISTPPGAPPGFFRTNVTTRKFTLTNSVSGEFYIIPPGLCAITLRPDLLNLQFVTAITNGITATNTVVGATNLTGIISQSVVTYFTNHAIAYLPIICPPPPPALRQGIERIQFVRANFDSLLGQFFQPLTNTYTMYSVTNSKIVPQVIQRTINQPDFLFDAADLADGPGNALIGTPGFGYARSVNFDVGNVLPALAGPGVIQNFNFITFNKVGPIFFNSSPNAYFIETAEANAIELFAWGSFDGSPNPPIAYPDGTSIANLAGQLVIQPNPAPPALPSASVGVPYNLQMTATGGQPPYTWVSPQLQSLGFAFSAGGLISGAPSTNGVFDVGIQLTDSANRVVNWNYSITINP